MGCSADLGLERYKVGRATDDSPSVVKICRMEGQLGQLIWEVLRSVSDALPVV